MAEVTPNLALPLLMAGQAQKHVTHNEALRLIDIVTQMAVLTRDDTTPPAAPDEGARYIVASGAGGAWDGRDGSVAAWSGGGWFFVEPAIGMTAWVASEDLPVVHDGAEWVPLADVLGLGDVVTTGDLATYLTTSAASATYATQAALGAYLTTAAASSTYATQASLGAYLTTSAASATYATQAALEDYLPRAEADDLIARGDAVELARSASGASTRLRILEQVIGLTGAEVWSAIEIPKGSTVLAVSLRVTEAITGAASFDCGVWGATDLFGTGIAVSAGAQNVTAITPAVFGADSAIVLTAQGSDFTGGKLVLAIHLLICGAPDAAPA